METKNKNVETSISNFDCMLTTFDNPFDPFVDFTSWLMFDMEMGYNTCSRLARLTVITDDLSEKEIENEIERAIDVLILNDFLNIFKKIKKKKE